VYRTQGDTGIYVGFSEDRHLKISEKSLIASLNITATGKTAFFDTEIESCSGFANVVVNSCDDSSLCIDKFTSASTERFYTTQMPSGKAKFNLSMTDDNDVFLGQLRIHHILCQAVETNHSAVRALQHNQFNTAANAFRQALGSFRIIYTCTKLSSLLPSEYPFATNPIYTEPVPVHSVDEMMESFLTDNVAFYGYAFDIHLKQFPTAPRQRGTCRRSNGNDMLKTSICDEKSHLVAEDITTVGDVVAACTSTILFNFALAFHRLGYTELSHWIKSGMQYLQEANNLYTVFH
jgi:hypothetical protein